MYYGHRIFRRSYFTIIHTSWAVATFKKRKTGSILTKRINSEKAPRRNLKGIYCNPIQKMRPLVKENAFKLYYDAGATFSAPFLKQETF